MLYALAELGQHEYALPDVQLEQRVERAFRARLAGIQEDQASANAALNHVREEARVKIFDSICCSLSLHKFFPPLGTMQLPSQHSGWHVS